jgi:hypothetical protein
LERNNFLPVGGIICRGQGLIVHGGVRAKSVVVMDKFLEQIFEMNFPEDKEIFGDLDDKLRKKWGCPAYNKRIK